MAAKKHTPKRARVRKPASQRNGHRSPRRHGVSRRHPVARATAVPGKVPTARELREAIANHIRGLRVALSAVVVAIAALRRQNGDIYEDIARVLARSAADRLDMEIEGLQSLIQQGEKV